MPHPTSGRNATIRDCSSEYVAHPRNGITRAHWFTAPNEVGAANVSTTRLLRQFSKMGKTMERGKGAEIEPAALADIVKYTQGYPYFLQEWGSHTWDESPVSPITSADVSRATVKALNTLDKGFFRVRYDRLTPREKQYMRAMAELGSGPHRSGDIAELLGVKVTTIGPLRAGLIGKGMIYSPQHGDTAFTVPMFDEFMKRSMPIWTPNPRRRPKGF